MFINLSSSGIDAGFFDFTEKDVENLLRLVNGLPSKEKIIIREAAKNKQSGNILFLFTFLNLIVRGGTFRMDTGPKESLNKLISNRFKFDNSEINVTTLPSSYSKWCSAIQDGNYDSLQIDISKALGIQ